jgi:hypothetical protein
MLVSEARPATRGAGPRSGTRAAVAIVGLGLALRLVQFAADRSLWTDEAALASNVASRSVAGLFRPLSESQAAPPIFLLLVKLASAIGGTGERVLRSPALASSIVALVLFAVWVRRWVGEGGRGLALAALAIATPSVFYAAELKPYATDVAVGLAIALGAIHLDGVRWSWPKLALAGAAAAIAPWLSFPSVFAIAGAVAYLASTSARGRAERARLLVPAALCAVSSFALHGLLVGSLVSDVALQYFWRGAFMPLVPRSLDDLRWYPAAFFRVFDDPVGLTLAGLGAFLWIVGAWAAWRSDRRRLFLLVGPTAAALAASAAHAYPFEGRMLLFAVPAALVLVGEGFRSLFPPSRVRFAVPRFALAALVLFHPALAAVHHLVRPITIQETRPLIDELRARAKPADVVYVQWLAREAFAWYVRDRPLDVRETIDGLPLGSDPGPWLAELGALRGKGRVWFLLASLPGAGPSTTAGSFDAPAIGEATLDRIGRRLERFEAPGASLVLYDL